MNCYHNFIHKLMSTHPFHNSGRTNHLNVNWWIANDHHLEQSRMSKLNTHQIMKQQNFHLGIMKQLLGWLRTALTRIHDILVLWREQMTALWLYGISKKPQKTALDGFFLRKSWFTLKSESGVVQSPEYCISYGKWNLMHYIKCTG